MAAIINVRDVLLQAASQRLLSVVLPTNISVQAAIDAQASADEALAALAVISSDNVLSAGEKPAVVVEYSTLTGEKAGIDAQADAYSVSRAAYDTAVTALTTYITGLAPAYDDFTQDTAITGTTFRQKFLDVYSARQSLLNAIYAAAKTLADNAQGTANTGVTNAAAAQSTANTAITNAAAAQTSASNAQTDATSALNQLTDIAADNKLTPVEKSETRARWDVIEAEVTVNDAQATSFGVTTEKTSYDNAFQALATYLNAGTAWVSGIPSWISDANLSTTTVIVGATFRSNWQAYYDARTALLNKIASVAATVAIWSGISGTGKPADNATVGATFGTNIAGSISAATAGTYIDAGALGTTQLANGAATATSQVTANAVSHNLSFYSSGTNPKTDDLDVASMTVTNTDSSARDCEFVWSGRVTGTRTSGSGNDTIVVTLIVNGSTIMTFPTVPISTGTSTQQSFSYKKNVNIAAGSSATIKVHSRLQSSGIGTTDSSATYNDVALTSALVKK